MRLSHTLCNNLDYTLCNNLDYTLCNNLDYTYNNLPADKRAAALKRWVRN